MRQDVFKASTGDRPGVDDVVILLSDGESRLDEDRVNHELARLAQVT